MVYMNKFAGKSPRKLNVIKQSTKAGILIRPMKEIIKMPTNIYFYFPIWSTEKCPLIIGNSTTQKMNEKCPFCKCESSSVNIWSSHGSQL